MDKVKKRLAKNFIFNTLYNTIGVLFPLITIPYLSRVLQADGLGKVSYATNIISWFILFASLGIPRYGVREIAKEKDNDINKTFTELFSINFISTVISVCVFLLMIFNVPYFTKRSTLYMVLGIQLFLNIFNVDWFYQGIEDFQYITIRSFVIKAISLVAMFIFVRNHDDYIVYGLLQSLAVAGNYLFNFFHIRRFCKLIFKSLQFSKHIRPILILTATQLAVSIYGLLDITMLGSMCSDKVVGYYTNVQKLMYTSATITASLGGALLPELVTSYKKNDLAKVKKISEKSLSFIITITLPITVGIIIVSKDIVLVLFGKNFNSSVLTLQIYAPFVIFSTIGNLFGTQLLMTFNEEQKLFNTTLIGAIVDFGLNIFLIKLFAQNGATLSSVLAEILVTIFQIYYVEKICNINFNKREILSSLISVLVMVIGLQIVMYLLPAGITRLVIAILLSASLYFITCIITKNESINLVKSIIFKK